MFTAYKIKFHRILAAFVLFGFLTLPTHEASAQDCSCGAPCYVLLDYDNIFGIEDFVACLTIEAGPDLVVEDSADVTLTAGESISLFGGFAVSKSATFSLCIDPLLFCDVTQDLDEDLSDACLDCDDDNSSVYPGAAEVCDGLDNDCDALIDEDAGSICDDGLFCSGVEICDGINGCLGGSPPCPGPDGDGNCHESCDEAGDNCNANDPDFSNCNDGDSCTVSDTCNAGICTGTTVEDGYENNNTRGTASSLGEIDTETVFPAGTISASLYGPGDVDWYKYHDSETIYGDTQPKLDLTSIPSGSNYNLCAYFACDDPGSSPSVGCSQGTSASYDGLPGCCSTNSGSSSENVSFTVDCDNSIITPDNSGWVYVRIDNASSTWSCSSYSLPWGDD